MNPDIRGGTDNEPIMFSNILFENVTYCRIAYLTRILAEKKCKIRVEMYRDREADRPFSHHPACEFTIAARANGKHPARFTSRF